MPRRLTPAEVAAIRAQAATRRYPQTTLAAMYGVSQHTISGIVRGRTWAATGADGLPRPCPSRQCDGGLSAGQVAALRVAYAAGGEGQRALARRYGISVPTLRVLLGRPRRPADPRARLTPTMVADCRQTLAAGDATYRQLAGEYGVSISTIWMAVHTPPIPAEAGTQVPAACGAGRRQNGAPFGSGIVCGQDPCSRGCPGRAPFSWRSLRRAERTAPDA